LLAFEELFLINGCGDVDWVEDLRGLVIPGQGLDGMVPRVPVLVRSKLRIGLGVTFMLHPFRE
jgi:hypothetical protein